MSRHLGRTAGRHPHRLRRMSTIRDICDAIAEVRDDNGGHWIDDVLDLIGFPGTPDAAWSESAVVRAVLDGTAPLYAPDDGAFVEDTIYNRVLGTFLADGPWWEPTPWREDPQ